MTAPATASSSTPRLALYRGRFDPPGLHHVAILRALLARFDRVVLLPWGPMPARPIDENVSPVYRARMIDLAFGRVDPRVVVDLRDLEGATISDTVALEHDPAFAGFVVSHVVEADSFEEDRARLPPEARLVVVATADAALRVPEGHERVVVAADVAGSVMRKRLYEGQGVDDLVPAAVARVIDRHGLYRGTEPRISARVRFDVPRLFLVNDERNEQAVAWARLFAPWAVTDPDDADLIVVLGGDGSMLHAIQTHWRRRVPFLGINAGHLGFLLNEPHGLVDDSAQVEALLRGDLVLHHLPMLHVEHQRRDGTWGAGLTFNDAWIERSSGQSAWLEVKVDGKVRLPRLVCDGVLVSTAAGSTAYARSMGAQPLLLDTPAWLVVGSNVMDPIHWKSALVGKNSVIEIRSLHVEKRPLVGFLHGVALGEVTALRARMSRAASVELAFVEAHDMAEKIARIQFPWP
jgi:NAD kinase/nicotinic acid mononucleotide adenylyltransferase